MATPDYDTDFYAWAAQQAAALRAKDWAALDVEHLAEEVEDLRKSEAKAVRSQRHLAVSHLLKWAYQPGRRSDSWQDTVREARRLVADWLEEDGSCRGYSAHNSAQAPAGDTSIVQFVTPVEVVPSDVCTVTPGNVVFWSNVVRET